MKVNQLTLSGLLIVLTLMFSQCQKPHERFERPDWLSGTNIETLENEGNYNEFLALMDRAQYRVSIENQLFTLFVPDDDSFKKYYSEIGVNSVEDLTVDEAEELFGQHILINPRSREKLIYEYAWGELQTPEQEYASLFHRKRTYSVPINYTETVKYNESYLGEELYLYRENTFVPLFTEEYFEDYFGAPSDYLYMYPNSEWSGTQWHDAMVTEAEVSTASGFIYYIDRVVAPIPTIEKHLKDNQDKFGLFYDIAQRFASYGSSRVNERDEREYRKSYDQISNIADERGPSTGDPTNMLYMFSAYVPYDNVLQQYLDNTVLKYYESIDSVPQLYLVYLLQSHLNSFLTLPSKMEERFLNYYGDRIAIDVATDIGEAFMCGNGVVYGMNKFIEPNVFSCVPGPIFYNKDYTTLLYALNESGAMNSLSQSEVTVAFFAPDNDKMEEYGIRANITGANVNMQLRLSDDTWTSVEMDDLKEWMEDFIYIGNIENFDGEGFLKMASGNYVYYNNNQLYSSGNQVDNESCQVIEKVPSNKNGNLFYVNKAFKRSVNAAERILADPDLSEFAIILDSAKVLNYTDVEYELDLQKPIISFQSSSDEWTVLAPTNQAIADARAADQVPDLTDIDGLKEFVYYHFIRENTVFDDGNFSGIVNTQLIDTVIGSEIFFETVNVINSPKNLSIIDGSSQTISIDNNMANMLVEHGVVHKVNSVLLSE